MASKTESYVDTSAFIALGDKSDSYHELFKQLFSNPPRLITTSLVIAEGHGWFLRRFDSMRALQFLAMIELMTPLKVLPADSSALSGATRYLRKFSDQKLTLADALGLHCMREFKISSCWSTDRHMGLTGVTIAIA